jgi:hypothetical protein
MHIEHNICDNLLKHIFGEKDILSTRRDMEEVGIHPWLWLQRRGSNFVKPIAPFVFNPHEIHEILEVVASIKAPTGYAAHLKNML